MFNISIITKYLKNVKNNYTLEKNNIYSKISDSPNITFEKNDKQDFDEKFNQYINNFIIIMKKNPNIDLSLFYENLKTLIIKEKRNFNKLFFIKSSTRGHYNSYENKILIQKEDNFYTIYHELLHCASRRIVKNEMNIGFHKFVINEEKGKITLNIGKSLTEGYTSLLEGRYFDSIEHTQKRGYVIEEFISSMLEKIVDRDKMEKLYFSADFDGLVNCLKQYSNKEDIFLFLKYLDKVFVNSKEKVKPAETSYIYKFIACFLLKTYIAKLIILFKENSITRKVFEELFDSFVKELSIHTVYDKKNTYYLLTNEITDQILDEISEELDKAKTKNKI